MIYSHKDYEKNPFLAVDAVGRLLGAGCLNLFLGAGISKGFGLPGWVTLVGRVLKREQDEAYMDELSRKSASDHGRLVDSVDDGGVGYLGAIHEALYRDVSSSLLEQLTRSPLLLAVVALLTGTRRGRIDKVFTYNYDDLLEQYLKLLGQSISIRTSPTDYSTWSDVELNHVHGFLPQAWTPHDKGAEVVLSEKSYRRRRAGIDAGWSAAVQNSLFSKAALLLGLSGDDTSMLDYFQRAKSSIQRTEDYHGYWLLTGDAYVRNASSILDVGMCPIPIDKEDLPRFVFATCQKALE